MTTYTATKTPADLTASGWYQILPPPPPPMRLAQSVTADWAVIGAGFAGLTAAKRLTERRPQDKVVVLDAQRIAWGAAGRNSGFMVDLPHDLASDSYASAREADIKQIRMNRVAIDYAARTVEQFGLHEHFSQCGKYHGAVDARDLQRLSGFCRHLDTLNEPWSGLDRRQMTEITGTDFYVGGMHAPGAAIIQPSGYIRGLADGLRHQRRVAIYENSPVVKIASNGGAYDVHTPAGKVCAAAIILAVNGHAEAFGFYRKRLLHVFTYASMTRALDDAEQRKLGGLPEWGLIPANPFGSTVRRYRDRIVVRNSFTYNPTMRTGERQVRRFGRRHEAAFEQRFPMLKGIPMQYRWGGAVCLSLNSVPAFGEVDERIYSAVCQNGLGVAKGSYAGLAAADLAVGENNPIVADLAAFDPPQKRYPEPFMSAAANAVIWWRQRKVGGRF